MSYFHTVNVIIENENNEICLVKRGASCVSMPNQFVLPGGRLEFSESIIDGAVRELKEETGLSVKPENLNFCYLHQRKRHDESIVFDFYFKATEWWGVPENKEPDKHDAVGFYDTAATSNIIQHHLDAIVHRHQKLDIDVNL